MPSRPRYSDLGDKRCIRVGSDISIKRFELYINNPSASRLFKLRPNYKFKKLGY
jgi:hypothetical protein